MEEAVSLHNLKSQWQQTVEMLVGVFRAATAMVVRFEGNELSVFAASKGPGHPYRVGDRVPIGVGHYCDALRQTGQSIEVPDAMKDPRWKECPDARFGMVHFIGVPIHLGDGKLFGALCVIDNVERRHDKSYRALLDHLASGMERDLKNLTFKRNSQPQDACCSGSQSPCEFGVTYEKSPVPHWQARGDRFTRMNLAMASMLGFDSVEEAMTASGWLNDIFLDTEDYERMQMLLSELGSVRDYEARVLRTDGTMMWVSTTAVLEANSSGVYIEGVSLDITDRKLAEQSINQREESLRATFAAIAEGVIVTDREARVLRMNPAAEALTGWSESEARDLSLNQVCRFRNASDSSDNDYIGPVERVLRRGRVERRTTSTILIDRSGGEHLITESAAPIRDDAGRLGGMVVVFGEMDEKEFGNDSDLLRDSHQQWSAQVEELSIENARLKTALSDLRAVQTRTIHSERMTALAHLASGIAHQMNTPLAAIKSGIDTLNLSLRDMLEQVSQIAGTISTKKLDLLYHLLRIDLMGTVFRLGLKERRKRKARLREQLRGLKVETPGKVADVLVDFGIVSQRHAETFLPLFEGESREAVLDFMVRTSDARRSAIVVETAARKAAESIFALKGYISSAKPIKETLRTVHLEEELENVLALCHGGVGNEQKVVCKFEEVPPLICNADELNQAWRHLIRNALEAMQGKGTLTLELRRVRNDLVVSISDQGPGIPGEFLPLVFEPFFTTKQPGENGGLGLGIAREIIKRHGGHLRLDSKIGVGTVVRVTLPLMTAEKNSPCDQPCKQCRTIGKDTTFSTIEAPHEARPSGKHSIPNFERTR